MRCLVAVFGFWALSVTAAFACDTPPTGQSGLFVAGQRVTADSSALSAAVAKGMAWRGSLSQRGRLLGKGLDYSDIFKAMACSQKRAFSFNSVQDLGTNIAIRMSVIQLMYDLSAGKLHMGFTANAFEMPQGNWVCTFNNPLGAVQMTGNPLGCTDNNPGVGFAALLTQGGFKSLSWETAPSVPAATAVLAFLNGQSMLDCLAGVEMIFLSGVELTIGPERFNALHPLGGSAQPALRGIGVPVIRTYEPSRITPRVNSVRTHLVPLRYHTLDAAHPHQVPPDSDSDPRTGAIAVADMVPGDYAYIESLPDYDVWHQGGGWNGENCVYIGQGRFYGLGLAPGQGGFETASALQAQLASAYNDPSNQPGAYVRQLASPNEMRWTLLAAPTFNGADSEAGPFLQ